MDESLTAVWKFGESAEVRNLGDRSFGVLANNVYLGKVFDTLFSSWSAAVLAGDVDGTIIFNSNVIDTGVIFDTIDGLSTTTDSYNFV